jgi:hypothetical protein
MIAIGEAVGLDGTVCDESASQGDKLQHLVLVMDDVIPRVLVATFFETLLLQTHIGTESCTHG